MFDLVYVGIFTVGNLCDTFFQVLYVVVQAVGGMLYLYTFVVPFFYLFGIGLVVGIQFAGHDIVTMRRIVDRSAQTVFH